MARAIISKASDPEAVKRAASIIKEGGLVAFPTETVYGLGADACNPIAVARIFEVKKRPSIDPLIVHLAAPEDADLYGDVSGTAAQSLIRRFWPGPLTLVVRKTHVVPPIVTAGLDTVALRMPSHPVALALIRCAGRPVAAPSANPFGYVSPTRATHVVDLLGERIDMILDGGRCELGVESTIVSLEGGPPSILRTGGVAAEELETIVGKLEPASLPETRPKAPGQLIRHYATNTPLTILSEEDTRTTPGTGEKVGLIALVPPRRETSYASVEILAPSGDLREAAANLFAALHRLDRLGLDRIIAHPFPEVGLGAAIMDRLRKCSAQRAADEWTNEQIRERNAK